MQGSSLWPGKPPPPGYRAWATGKDHNMDQLRVGIVGLGHNGFAHATTYFHHPKADLVAVCDFDEDLSRLAYAASDFVLMPSRFEPCGLPQMIGPIYGTLPVVHCTGGLRDTVTHIDTAANRGNGFVFEHYDAQGLRWAVEQALAFQRLPDALKDVQVARVMREARARFTHDVTARAYIDVYERMLQRPLVN